jgi:hypothetical protein
MIIKVANQTHHTSNLLTGISNMARYDADYEDVQDFFTNVQNFNVKSEISDAMFTVIKKEFIPLLTDKIKRKGLVGRTSARNRGDGPRLTDEEDAWHVDRVGNMNFLIRTDERVAERAFFLEYGTDTVTPTTKDALKFKPKISYTGRTDEDGYIYRQEVDGVRAYGYFREAVREFNTSQRVKEEFEGEITDRVKNALRLR